MKVGSHLQAGSAFISQVASGAPTHIPDAYDLANMAKNTTFFSDFVNDFNQPVSY